MSGGGDLTAYRAATRQRLEGAFDFAAAGDQALRIGQQVASRMSRTVTRQGDVEYTSKFHKSGRKRSERERVMMQAVANRCSVYWGFKGLGKAFGYGFYNCQKFRFNDTEDYDAAPVWLFDLTSTPNAINNVAIGMNPGYRMYVNNSVPVGQGKVKWGPLNSQGVGGGVVTLAKNSPNCGVAIANGWDLISTQGTNNAANRFPYAQDYISNIDIKLDFFSARDVPSRFEYDVVSLPSDLVPFNANDSEDYIERVPDDMIFHDSYWINSLVPFTNHPLNMQKGVRAGAQHTGFWKNGAMHQLFESPKSHLRGGGPQVVKFDPRNTSVSESGGNQGGRLEYRKIELYPERVVDLGNRPRTIFANNATTDGVNNTNTGDAQGVTDFSNSYQVSPKAEQRLFLIIRSTDFTDITAKNPVAESPLAGTAAASYYGGKINDINLTKVDFSNSGSFDVNIIKKCIRNN